MAESTEEPQCLDEVKEESERAALKLHIKNTKIMASSLSNSWQIEGEKEEAVTDFISWAPKSLQMVTDAMKLRRLFFGRKAITKPHSILKSRNRSPYSQC